MTTTAIAAAKERQIDWLLAEVLGGTGGAAAPKAMPWLAAAVALFAIGVALGVAWLRTPAHDEAQAPPVAPPWHECHGAVELCAIPADVSHLRCFDFDDAACAQLGRIAAGAEGRAGGLPKLTHLDLSGMDVDAHGVARSIPLTDEGVRALAPLTNLRWLSLEQCHAMRGEGLQVLEAMPRLEHLDLTYSGVESPAIERLPRLPSLRTLVLSHCMNFHGRSLAAVAKIPGLRRLELRACTTLAAKDALQLVQLKELRHLDLRDCQGRFRGQTASGFSVGGEEPPPPPVQDGIGITDAVVEALSALPLETLLLGGSESLTDAIGESIAKMTTLRSLDLSNLPKTTGALLAKIPPRLTALWLDDNGQFAPADLARVPAMPALRTLGLSGLQLDEATLRALLADKPLTTMALGGVAVRGKGDGTVFRYPPTTAAAVLLAARIATLEHLSLRDAPWVDRTLLAEVAKLPRLRSLDLTAPLANPLVDRTDAVRALAASRSLTELTLVWSRLDLDTLRELHAVPLQHLDLRGTNLRPDDVRELGKAWPGCTIRLPNGQRFRAP